VVTPYIGAAAQTPQTFTSAALSQVLAGLTNGTSYTFTVGALTDVGPGATSAPSAPITIGVPTAVAFLRGTGSSGKATLTWWPAAANGSPVTNYAITPYLAGVAQGTPIITSSNNTQVISGLTNGSTYTFTVAAVNARGAGPAVMSPAITVNAAVAGAPTSVAAVAGSASATVTWKAPSSDGGSSITGYVVTPFIGSVAQTPQTFASTAVMQVVSGLTNGSTYTFTVAAVNGVGTGTPSAASAPVTIGTPPAPAFLRTAAGDGQVKVSWWPYSPSSPTPVTGYVITPYIAGVAQTPQVFNSTGASEVVTGLTNGTTYTFSVSAFNLFGQGPGAMTGPATPSP